VYLSGIDLLLWAASFFGHLALLVVLLVRKRAARFPWFTALVVLNILRTIALYAIRRYATKSDYFYSYWSLAIVDEIVQLAVIYELARQVFRASGSWARDMRSGLLAWIAGSLALAALMATLAPPQTRLKVQTVIIKGSMFSSVLLTELFLGMIVLSIAAGLPWRTHAARIAQGLGVYSLITVILEAGHTWSGLLHETHTYQWLSRARIAVYLGCLVYWIVTLWRDDRPMRELTDDMRSQLSSLQAETAEHLSALRKGQRR
jgi:hypothetical protein